MISSWCEHDNSIRPTITLTDCNFNFSYVIKKTNGIDIGLIS